jgi:hypothetical protein
LRFTVEPITVPYSTEQAMSVVELAVTMTNDGTAPVTCGEAVFTFAKGDPTTTLSDDPSTITTAPGDATPWAISSDRTGVAHALTLPPASGLAPGGAASFIFGAIVVNRSPGHGGIDIAVTVDGVPVHGEVVVQKDRPAKPGEGTPIIAEFAVEPERIALGGTATVSWQVVGSTTCILEPGPVPLPSPDQGELPVSVWDSTIYNLVALSASGTARATASVAVMPVSIDAFTASPRVPITPGVEVTLEWQTRYARTCSIDQGVGPVDTSGSIKVKPMQTTVYTLTASGLDQRAASVTVTVSP